MKMTAGEGWLSASARATPIPSWPGIAISSSSRSGVSACAIRTVLSPSVAVPTRSMPSILASSNCNRSAASGSSSAMRTRKGTSGIRSIQRQGQEHTISAVAPRPIGTFGERTEARRQALADVGDADSGADGTVAVAVSRRRPPARVGDLDRETAGSGLARHDLQCDLVASLGHRMLDRILDDRLQQQRRQAGRLELCGNVEVDLEPAWETDLFDVEIEALQGDLLGQADVRRGIERQARAEEGRQLEDHRFGLLGAAGDDQRRQGIERVEQEMRIDLVAQRPDLG